MFQDIEQYLSGENRKESEVVNVRLENIKLKNKLKKKEHQLKSKVPLKSGVPIFMTFSSRGIFLRLIINDA